MQRRTVFLDHTGHNKPACAFLIGKNALGRKPMLRNPLSSTAVNRCLVWAVAVVLLFIVITGAKNSHLRADTGMCGGQTITLPFTDVMGSTFFCSIAEIYFQGIT